MPPATSHIPSPSPTVHEEAAEGARTPPSYISALSEALESPDTHHVYNLAATLTTPADGSFSPGHEGQHLETSQELAAGEAEAQHGQPRTGQQRDRSDRLRRVMDNLGHMRDEPRAAYGDRVPSQNHLYDWSPINEDDTEHELDQILAELRREQPNTHPEILRVLGQSQLALHNLHGVSQPSQPAEGSLRSSAILQSVRRHPRFAARSRESAQQRHHSDRNPPAQATEPRDARERLNASESARQTAAMQRLANRRTSLDLAREQLRERDSSRPRSTLQRSSAAPASAAALMLEETIKYLSRIRSSSSMWESMDHAIDAGFMSRAYSGEDPQDFVLDPSLISPPAESSWLAPGAVLSGFQHATTVTSTITGTGSSGTSGGRYPRFFDASSWRAAQSRLPPRTFDHELTVQQYLASEAFTSHAPQQDKWPVKVTIHSVDYERMSLTATMEAYNVPSHPHQLHSLLNNATENTSGPLTRTSSITTYLEGEILDFNAHTLLTESFKSSASNDATYWRKLPPFSALTDDEMIQNLTSRHWLSETLGKDWILMRWKERCFVKGLNRAPNYAVQPHTAPSSFSDSAQSTASSHHVPSGRDYRRLQGSSNPAQFWGTGGGDTEHGSFDDSGCGLTISGFYYVSLRRSDGKLEGLYFDPQSSPYQCLKLDSVRGGVFPAWRFR